MEKLFCLKNFIFLFGFSFGLAFLFNAGLAKADFASCGITQTDPIWEIKNSSGARVLAIDSAGNLDIVSANVHIATDPPQDGLSDTFIIKRINDGEDYGNFFTFNSFDVYIMGFITQNADQATIDNTNGVDLLIKNSSGENVARFDAVGGNIYIKGNSCAIFEISTCAELQNINNNLYASYVLTQDIDCSDTVNWNNGAGFQPINATFYGNFDGKGHVIRNLYINRSDNVPATLFFDTYGADIKNVGLVDVDITGNNGAAGLVYYFFNGTISDSYVTGNINSNAGAGGLVVGNNYSTILNSYFIGNVSGDNDVGGLVSSNYNGASIVNSYSAGNVFGNNYLGGLVALNYDSSIADSYSLNNVNATNSYAGGFVGRNYDGVISNSYSTGDVSGVNYVGGFVSENTSGDNSLISNSYSSGDVSGVNYVGGFVSYHYGDLSFISNSYSTGDVSGINWVGGSMGIMYRSSITNVYSSGKVSGTGSYIGGFIGSRTLGPGSISNSYWNKDFAGVTGCGSGSCTGATGKTTNEMISEGTYSSWTFQPPAGDTWKLSTITPAGRYYPCLSWQSNATCAIAAPVAISTCAELQNIQNDLGGNYFLKQDVDCSATTGWNGGAGFDPIRIFTGNFDGQGHVIQNLYINRSGTNYVGLFGRTDGADIKNVGLTNINITGSYYTGGLVGWNNNSSSILNSYSTGNVVGTNQGIGGLVGRNENSSSVSDSYSTCSVSGSGVFVTSIGGLVGQNFGPIANSYSTGNVIGSNFYIGGLIGYNTNSSISNSYATGNVANSGNSFTGGLIGYNINSSISNSYATGSVSGINSTGGLVGYSSTGNISSSYSTGSVSGRDGVGGLVGGVAGSTITGSYAIGDINSSGNSAGGLAGTMSVGGTSTSILNSYSTGNIIIAGNYGGGLVGYTQGSNAQYITISKSYATGDVNGGGHLGGLVGFFSYGQITSSYSLGDVSGVQNGSRIGGLAGFFSASSITSSYSIGKVNTTGGLSVGGLVGETGSSGTISSSYWNTELSGQASGCGLGACTGATGKTTAQMVLEDTYPNPAWKFQPPSGDTWKLSTITPSGKYYPCLSWQDDATCPSASTIILSCTDLQKIGNDASYPLNGSYSLTQDIDCSDTVNWNGGLGFDPIGNLNSAFVGSFSGKDYIIDNLYINRPTENYVGLFGYTSHAHIQKIGVININVNGHDYTGGLVGFADYADIYLSYSTGNISGSYGAGGLVGWLNHGQTMSSYSTSNVVGFNYYSNYNYYIGGLVGLNNNGSIRWSYSTGDVSSFAVTSEYIGGLTGGNAAGWITYSYSTSDVSSSGNSVGGLIGVNYGNDILKSYSTGNVSGSSYVGGFVGHATGTMSGTITDSYSTGGVSGSGSYVGGFAGSFKDGYSVSGSYWNKDVAGVAIGCGDGSCAGVTGKTTNEMVLEGTYSGWRFQPPSGNDWKLSAVIPSGRYYPCIAWQDDATCPLAPIAISSCQELQNIQYGANNDYFLTQNINCAETATWNPNGAGGYYGFNPIGYTTFFGVLNGRGYTIQNLYINRSTENNVGLFRNLSGAVINNIGLTNVNITGGSYTGGLVGSSNYNSSIVNSYSSGSVRGARYSGGLVGENAGNSSITNSYSAGSMNGSDMYIGGLVGYNVNSSVVDSYSTSNVSGSSYHVGGLVGVSTSNSSVINSHATGSVSGSSTGTAGLVSYNGNGSSILESYSTGNVSGVYDSGGLVGLNYYNSSITDSYSTGNVSGTGNCAGGLIGGNNTSSITRAYSVGIVTGGGSYRGGLIGYYPSGSISSSYWNKDVAGITGCGYGTCTNAIGKSTVQMKQQGTYSGWNFTSIWNITNGITYPFLR